MPLPSPHALALFVVAGAVLLLTPGPAVLYIVARSLEQGRMAGLASALGLSVGGAVYLVATIAGVSALIAASPLAFAGLKWAGAVYLVWLGVQRFRRRDEHGADAAVRAEPLRRVFRQGVVVNLLNPKAALFFFAFLPQFVDPARGSATLQMVALGLVFLCMGITSDTLYALAAGTIGGWLRSNPRAARAGRYASGVTYIALGIVAALAGTTSQL